MRFVALILFLSMMISTGCSHKPAYSNVNVSRQREAPSPQTAAEPASPTEPSQGAPAQQPGTENPAQVARVQAKIPSFLDQATGSAKDIPRYPKSVTASISYGPMQGHDTLSLALQSHDSMDKIADFYDKALKANNWTIVDKTRDVELSEWVLKKGDRDEGKVQIRKAPTGGLYIIIVRVELNEGAASTASR